MKTALAALLLVATTLLNAQSAVKHVHRIYVDELHFPNNPDWDGLVRSKLISSLVQDCGSGCTVVEDVGPSGDNGSDTADGVLTGTVLVQSSDNRRYRIQGAMRLVDKDGAVLWAATVYSSPFARSASSSFADNTAKKLASFLAQPAKTQ
ncbi:MAG: hypothetical protein WCA49_22845 [Candidatus Sulfotelmatobacter sp.]